MASTAGPQLMSDFLHLLSSLATDSSTNWIDQVLKDNEAMKASVEEQRRESDVLGIIIARLNQNLEEERAKSKDSIAQADEAKAKAGDMAAQLEDAKNQLAEKDQQLQQGAQVTQDLQKQVEDSANLVAEKEQQLEQNTQVIQNLQKQVEDSANLVAEKDQQLEEKAQAIQDLQKKLEACEKDVEECNQTIKKLEENRAKILASLKEQKKKLEMTEDELKAKSTKLDEVEQLSHKMVTASKDSISVSLQKLYNAAKSLATKYFGADLPETVFTDALFKQVRDHLWFYRIPFPASNSIAAKKVRIAAFMFTLGSKLTAKIFVPFYTLRPSDDIDDVTTMLSSLSRQDQKRELHLRSVLLAISPSQQKQIAHARGLEIAEEVFTELGVLLKSDQQSTFEQDIKKFCELAVESWECLRPLKDKIEPFDEDNVEHSEKYWIPADLDPGTQQKQQVNGKSNVLASKPSMHTLNASKFGVCVWPGFLVGDQVLKQGIMLLDSQLTAAQEENTPLTKRDIRKLQRANSGSLQLRHSVHKKS